MILKLINSLLGVFFCTIGSSQHWDIDTYELDSLKVYKTDVDTYTFYLNSGSQGLYINLNEVDWYPQIFLKIVNNTGETVKLQYREKDGHLVWLRNNSSYDSLAAGDTMILRSGWVQSGGYGANFHSPINIPYNINGEEFNCIIRTWGQVKINSELREKKNSSSQTANILDTNAILPESSLIEKNYPPLVYEKNDTFYLGERVNRINRKDLKVGKWVVLNENNQPLRFEYYSGKDPHWDSALFFKTEYNPITRKVIHVHLSDTSIREQLFNDQGVLYRSYLWNGDSIQEPEKKFYYESGNIKCVYYPYPDKQIVDYYPEGGIQKITSYSYNGKIDTIMQFYPSGQLQYFEPYYPNSDKPRKRITYDEAGRIISEVESYSGATNSYTYYYDEDSVLYRDRLYNGNLISTDKGIFKDNVLWTGIRIQVNQREGLEGYVFVNGIANGQMYKGEWINHSDSAGYQGKHMTFHWQSYAILSVATYHDGYVDSVVCYYESGEILSLHYAGKTYVYYKSGQLKEEVGGFASDTLLVSYYESGRKYQVKFPDRLIYHYNDDDDSCAYKMTYYYHPLFANERDPVGDEIFYAPDITGYSNFEEFYTGCKLVKRIYPKYFSVLGVEEDSWEKKSYRVEEGYFKDGELYTGYRTYYSSSHQLVEKKRVVKGVEV